MKESRLDVCQGQGGGEGGCCQLLIEGTVGCISQLRTPVENFSVGKSVNLPSFSSVNEVH